MFCEEFHNPGVCGKPECRPKRSNSYFDLFGLGSGGGQGGRRKANYKADFFWQGKKLIWLPRAQRRQTTLHGPGGDPPIFIFWRFRRPWRRPWRLLPESLPRSAVRSGLPSVGKLWQQSARSFRRFADKWSQVLARMPQVLGGFLCHNSGSNWFKLVCKLCGVFHGMLQEIVGVMTHCVRAGSQEMLQRR